MKDYHYYSILYNKFILSRSNRCLHNNVVEVHHIIPRCMGGTDDSNNLIALTVGCVKQAYKLGGGQLKDWKNPEGEDPTHFKDWMKCYGRLEKTLDRTGRTFWYDKKWKKDEN